MTTDEAYDSDDYFAEGDRLQEVKVSLKPVPSPPPYVPDSTSSSDSSPEPGDSDELASGSEVIPKRPRKSKRRRRHHKASLGDTVLINVLAPNRPDIAQLVGQTPISAAQSEAEDEEDEEEEDKAMGSEQKWEIGIENARSRPSLDAATIAKQVLELERVEEEDDDAIMDGVQRSQKLETLPTTVTGSNKYADAENGGPQTFTKPDLAPLPLNGLNIKPPPRSPRPVPHIITGDNRSVLERSQDEDSTPISPSLAKYAIQPSQVHPDSILPAMQKSPPRSDSMHSPEGSQNLPSLQTTLSQISESDMNGVNGPNPFPPPPSHSPTFVRHSPHASQGFGPSPGSYSQPSPGMSPPAGFPSHPTYWRTAPRADSTSTPSSYQTSTPASVQGPSPEQSYPTPTIQDHRGSIDGSSTPQLINGPLSANGPFTSSAFKCTHPGCTAAPFQTQYLLNSHANVHSSSRPHFCPVADCPRGPGGKGFKRKNEMIRHGLVHQSPGYIW